VKEILKDAVNDGKCGVVEPQQPQKRLPMSTLAESLLLLKAIATFSIPMHLQ
jgi:hypothetical protein